MLGHMPKEHTQTHYLVSFVLKKGANDEYLTAYVSYDSNEDKALIWTTWVIN